jgi:hypothetical protein
MLNAMAERMTQLCVATVRKFTEIPYDIWVIDNNSPWRYRRWLRDADDLNVVLLNTVPVQHPDRMGAATRLLLASPLRNSPAAIVRRSVEESYAKGVCLELGVRLASQGARHVFTMDSDCLALKEGWLSFLLSKLRGNVRVAGMTRDRTHVHAVASNGCLFDLVLFRALNLDMLSNIRQARTTSAPEYDTGDLITLCFRRAGYEEWVCRNTYNDPELVACIPAEQPLRHMEVTRCFDDEGALIYAHMGRGVRKAAGTYHGRGKAYPGQWIRFAEEHLLA